MDLFLDLWNDALIDTARLLPFLFLCYLMMEFIEHRASERSVNAISNTRSLGPLVGALLGAFPQCGFSAAAATLYAGRVVTIGTLIAVFLATSDEMLPIFIAEQVDPVVILKILGAKVAIGMVMGFLIDAAIHFAHRDSQDFLHIHELCEDEGCECDDEEHHHGIFLSSLKHTLQVALFIFFITFAINLVIALVGEDTFAAFIAANEGLSIVASAIVGLIPNCAASVVITELYLEGTLGAGAMMSGLLVSAGIGLLVLVRTNHHWRENIQILLVMVLIGIIWGTIIQLAGITF